MIQYKEIMMTNDNIDCIKEIYASENWIAYLCNDEKLLRAFENSLFILGAFDGDVLVGFARCVGDGEHILLLQDFIVDVNYRQRGIGKQLFQQIWEKYQAVRMFQVVIDLENPVANQFYQSAGMKSLVEGSMISYYYPR
ncbi:MAG: GNAT family N-acetyltransferase [Culicoidibacterales bacterium]